MQGLDRWTSPFDPAISDQDLDRILGFEPFRSMDPDNFPAWEPLREIMRNDTRLRRYGDGEIVVRAGDYGNSAFLVLAGTARVVLDPQLPEHVLGRRATARRSVVAAFSRLWTNPREQEVRDVSRRGAGNDTVARVERGETRIFLQDLPRILGDHTTRQLGPGEIFGEIAALGRSSRTATVFAEGDVELLEMRWQGLRDIRQHDDAFRDHIDGQFRALGLKAELEASPLFQHLPDEAIAEIADATLFETYGEYDWYASYEEMIGLGARERLEQEPLIAEEGGYADGLIIIRSGFAREAIRINNGHRTINFLGRGRLFGLEEIAHNWRSGEAVVLRHSLRALGYVHALRVPTALIEELVLPTLPESQMPATLSSGPARPKGWRSSLGDETVEPGLLEFLAENQFINGSAAMLINLERCVRCDDCVRACAAVHDNNPRFVRHGRRHGAFMVANACMHCQDPVCMIGCPTGAIHRSSAEGQVVINDDTCIGCQVCAKSCPYDNIRMVEIRDDTGNFILDEASNQPILKATKCDLCVDQVGGPACQRACPHDALRRVDLSSLELEKDWLRAR